MARYGVKTNKSPEEIIQQALDFFGEDGVGLKVMNRSPCCASFEGGGGHVSVTVTEGEQTEIGLVTREFDYDVKQFMRQII